MDPKARDRKHRTIGIRHVLKKMKNAGLVEHDSMYADEAVSDIQNCTEQCIVTWYQVGAKRGALEILDAFLDGTLKVTRNKKTGKKEIISSVDDFTWVKRLKITVGKKKRTVAK